MSSSIPTAYLSNTAAALGLFITVNNIYGALNPRGALNQLGFPVPISPSDQTLVNGVVRMFATTRICVGVSTLGMWWFGNHKALGISMVVGCVMAISDGYVTLSVCRMCNFSILTKWTSLVSRQVSGKREWAHWWAAPVGTAIGIGLLMGPE